MRIAPRVRTIDQHVLLLLLLGFSSTIIIVATIVTVVLLWLSIRIMNRSYRTGRGCILAKKYFILLLIGSD